MNYLTKQAQFQHSTIPDWNIGIVIGHSKTGVRNDVDRMPRIGPEVFATEFQATPTQDLLPYHWRI